MKMRLLAASVVDWEENPSLLNTLLTYPFITKEKDEYDRTQLFIEVSTIQNIKDLLESISETIYNDSVGWHPYEAVVDPFNKILTIRDYYLE